MGCLGTEGSVSYQNLKIQSDRGKFESKHLDTRVCTALNHCTILKTDKPLRIMSKHKG